MAILNKRPPLLVALVSVFCVEAKRENDKLKNHNSYALLRLDIPAAFVHLTDDGKKGDLAMTRDDAMKAIQGEFGKMSPELKKHFSARIEIAARKIMFGMENPGDGVPFDEMDAQVMLAALAYTDVSLMGGTVAADNAPQQIGFVNFSGTKH